MYSILGSLVCDTVSCAVVAWELALPGSGVCVRMYLSSVDYTTSFTVCISCSLLCKPVYTETCCGTCQIILLWMHNLSYLLLPMNASRHLILFKVRSVCLKNISAFAPYCPGRVAFQHSRSIWQMQCWWCLLRAMWARCLWLACCLLSCLLAAAHLALTSSRPQFCLNADMRRPQNSLQAKVAIVLLCLEVKLVQDFECAQQFLLRASGW